MAEISDQNGNATSNGSILHRSACAECQRRKQKCNREWPCNHCQKRKVADKCRFTNIHSPGSETKPKSPQYQNGTRRARSSDGSGSEGDANETISSVVNGTSKAGDGPSDGLGLESLGYMAAPLLARLGIEVKRPVQEQDWAIVEDCPQLERALNLLPSRTKMDALVQSFFNNVNFHYYIIYPPTFLQEYQQWWDLRTQRKPLSLQWTCLLVMLCACATQHLDVGNQPTIDLDLGGPISEISEQYHDAARELASVIPVGRYHLLNVQRMLHSIYWFKAEARFLEAWHVINAAVREAQELGLHKEAASEPLPEFEREMRRRAWCILDSWDWQFASGLYRPTIIDHMDVDVKLPTLTLEDFTPSPLLHMKLQSELICELAARFSAPKYVTDADTVLEYKGMIEAWIRRFPAVYDVDNPDRSKDPGHPWITFHRYYIHTMAYLMILNPMRAFMAKTYHKSSPAKELQIRADGVYYSLRNLDCTTSWVEHVSHGDGRFHFIIFSLFDTAAVLSTAIIKDADGTIPRRQEILDAISHALSLLRGLNTISKTAKTSYDILTRLARRLPKSRQDGVRKKARMKGPSRNIEEHQETNGHTTQLPSEQSGQSHLSNEDVHIKEEPTAPSPIGTSITAPELKEESPKPVDVNTIPAQSTSSSTAETVSSNPAQQAASTESNGNNMDLEGMADPDIFSDTQAPGGAELINDAVLGDFTTLWDWPSLELDFISSQTPRAGGG